MSWPKRLVLVRHAESIGNLKSVNERAESPIATHDYELSDRGIKQAKITGDYIKHAFGDFDGFFVSYYKRSKQTMTLMYPQSEVYEDSRLAEGQRGVWHVMTNENIEQRYPEEIIRRNIEGLYHYRPLGGENWPDMELRIQSFISTLSREFEDKKVLIVVHGHWLILFQRLIHRFSIEEAIRRYHGSVYENASVTVYQSTIGEDGKKKLIPKIENYVPWLGKLSSTD